MKRITFLLTIAATSLGLFAQDFDVPNNYILEKAEDYAPYEKNVMNCINWLMNTPIEEEVTKRSEANSFVLAWLMGSPYVHIELKQEMIPYTNDTPELLMIFLCGWTRFALETRDFDNKIEGNYAGIEAVIEYYTNNKLVLGKNKEVDKLIKMKEKDKLKEFVQSNI